MNEMATRQPNKAELLDILDEMRVRIENLPPAALYAALTNADMHAFLILFSAIMRAEE